MHRNPDYAKMFRGRPLRFVLPLNTENADLDENLVDLENSKATAFKLSNCIWINPELLYDLGCETPRINYERCLGQFVRKLHSLKRFHFSIIIVTLFLAVFFDFLFIFYDYDNLGHFSTICLILFHITSKVFVLFHY